MTDSKSRKKIPVVFLASAFLTVLALTVLVNRRTDLEREVRFPFNNGVAYLLTRGNYLAAACHDNKVYVWDWNNLASNPRVVEAQSDQAVLSEQADIISTRRVGARTIVVANLDNNVNKNIPIEAEDKRVYLAASRNGRTIAAVLSKADNVAADAGEEVVFVDCNAGLVRPVTELAKASGSQITSMAISDEGDLAVLTGEKAGQGWAVLVNIENRQIVWAEKFPDFKKIRNSVFSTDDRVLYIRGTDSSVQILDTRTGKVLKKLLPTSENKSTVGEQHVQTLATSNDGRLMAASISNNVYVWELTKEKVILHKVPGHKLVSGLAFSPDSRYLATSDSRQGGTIKIWRIPKR